MIEPKHEDLVAVAMLGLAQAEGWIEVPITFNVNAALEVIEAGGGVGVDRSFAVDHTRHFCGVLCDLLGIKMNIQGTEEMAFELLLAKAYDNLVEDQA